MKLLVFHNPNAGHDDVPRDTLAGELQRAGHEVLWAELGGTDLGDALAQPLDAVIVAGGDGSVGTVGRALAGRSVPIGIVPTGTANNIASVVGATRTNLVSLLASGRTVPFDVGVVDGIGPTRRFLEGVGCGAFAETVAILDAGGHDRQVFEDSADELDRDRHVLAARVREIEACGCELELDGRDCSGDFLMVEVTNAGVIGPRLQLSSAAVPSDGLLDVVVVDVVEREELLAFVAGHTRRIEPAPPFAIREARRVRLRLPAGCNLHIDGEVLHRTEPLELRIGIEPAALRFFGSR